MTYINSLNNFIRQRIKAFTLVEMSIALVIIGLLTSTVIVGQDLIRTSNITATIAEVEKVKQAVKSFELQYGGLPGDITDSTLGSIPSAAGHGNGVISGDEDVLFWRHLNESKLYTGNFSGLPSDRYITTSGPAIGGIPSGKISHSGLRIVSSSNGLSISLDGYSNTANDLGILTPSEAFGIDQKYDDGMASTGQILAFDGSNVAINSCVLGSGAYAVSNSTSSCRMTFLIEGLKVTTATANTCAGGYPVGSTRQSSTLACPYGQVGKILEECMANSSGVALWQASRNTCKNVECGYGLSNGESLSLPCPAGYLSNSASRILLTCNPSGFLSITNSCAIQTENVCRFMDGSGNYAATRTLACPISNPGYVSQECDGSYWNTFYDGCSTTALTCSGGIAIGGFEAAGTLANCGNANYSPVGGANITRGCRLGPDGTAAFDNPLHSRCLPSYIGPACTPGNTRDIGCPIGYTGSHIQLCVTSSNYTTQTDTCIPITCGGDPIGSFRISRGILCNEREEGYVIEVCTLNTAVTPNRGDWIVHTSSCSTRYCPSRSTDQNSGLGTYTSITGFSSHNSHVAGSCPTSPYTNNINNSYYSNSSRCGLDGTWQARNGSCLAAACPDLNVENTTDPYDSTYFNNMIYPTTRDYGGSNLYAPEHGGYDIVTLAAPGNAPAPEARCNNNYGSLFSVNIANDTKVICSDRGYWVDFCSTAAQNGTYANRIGAIANKRSCLAPLNSDDSSAPFSTNASATCSASDVGIIYRTDANNNNFCDGTDASTTITKCQSCNISELYCLE